MTTLGKYELHEEIGRGGFATVHRATHTLLESEAAVKVLDQERLTQPQARQRMEREARIAAGLSHPHLVKIFDLIQEGETLAIAMEYLRGGNLRQWLEKNPHDVPTILDILAQVASALDYLHSQRYQSDRPLLHRDVKPENVLLDRDPLTGQPLAKLSDFGLALDPQSATSLTQAQNIPGTAYYVSPEIVEVPSEALDGRSDQYSLAVMAYELLTGKRPFEGKDPVAVMTKRLDEPPPRPSEVNPETPLEFDEPLLKALQKAPENRYATCAEFVRKLQESWQASLLRRVRELVEAAQAASAAGEFKQARDLLRQAEALVPGEPRIEQARRGIDRQAELAQRYQQAHQNWLTAQQKARAVLDLAPDFPDPQGILVTLGARPPRKAPFDWRGLLLQIGVALLLAAPLTLLLHVLAILWILNKK
jgi:serine/threonine-protein kinase